MDLGVIQSGEVAKLVDEYGLEGGERYLEITTARVIHPVDELAVQEGEPFDDLGTRRNRVAERHGGGPIRKEGRVREAEHLRADAEERIEDRPVGVEYDDILASGRGGAPKGPRNGPKLLALISTVVVPTRLKAMVAVGTSCQRLKRVVTKATAWALESEPRPPRSV